MDPCSLFSFSSSPVILLATLYSIWKTKIVSILVQSLTENRKHVWWGRGIGRSQQSTPCHPDKELERTQGNLPIFLGQACRGRGGAGVPLHSHPSPMLCLSLQTVNIGVVTSLIKASVSLKNMESG